MSATTAFSIRAVTTYGITTHRVYDEHNHICGVFEDPADASDYITELNDARDNRYGVDVMGGLLDQDEESFDEMDLRLTIEERAKDWLAERDEALGIKRYPKLSDDQWQELMDQQLRRYNRPLVVTSTGKVVREIEDAKLAAGELGEAIPF